MPVVKTELLTSADQVEQTVLFPDHKGRRTNHRDCVPMAIELKPIPPYHDAQTAEIASLRDNPPLRRWKLEALA
jgi:hypothetical protein